MEYLIIPALFAALLFASVAGGGPRQPQPTVIYVQAAPPAPESFGCLPLIVLVGFIVAVIAFT